ncbi:MAG: hypothetical protein HYR88_07355 [Verrucomicrobia bacterium]|nr:hypothetical protein [Verrucomicrobiota bacterium]MBI3867320.1 hypothetical protein [Verrucomicrobiota bacterium]
MKSSLSFIRKTASRGVPLPGGHRPAGDAHRPEPGCVRTWRAVAPPSVAAWILALAALVGATTRSALADEQLFGFVRGAETLPKGRSEIYQYATLRTGKAEGRYYGFDFETEVEHGFTDRFQASASLIHHYFNNRGVDGDRDALDDANASRLGGVAFSGKYRIWSPFKEPLGIAFRLESGYLWHDEVDGLLQHEFYLSPEIDLQKNFRDDTVICNLNVGAEWAWGKQPAEQYPREVSLQAAAGVAYRFAPNWFVGAEGNVRAEYPLFDLKHFEHATLYAGPSVHYSAKRWWVTLTWTPQVWGSGVDEPNDGRTFAEEVRHKIRLKIGFNF